MTQQTTESQRPPMVDAAEARRQLGVGKTKFYALLAAGELKAKDISPGTPATSRRVGETGKRRVLRISQAEIDRYLAERDAAAS